MGRRERLTYQTLSGQSRSVMVETRRQFRMARMRVAAKPFTGPYYWIPLPDGSWDLKTFADSFYKGYADHSAIWPEVVSVMAQRWGKDEEGLRRDLQDAPYGLPRGRVVQQYDKSFAIAQGEDTPEGVSLDTVAAAYNLPKGRFRVYEDDHEHVIMEHVNLIKRVLGTKAQYEVPEPPDPFADEFDDDWESDERAASEDSE